MLNLFLKDYRFTRKYLLMAFVFCLALPPLLILIGGSKVYYSNFFIPYLTVSIVLGKICSIEDKPNIRCVINKLPYKLYKKVAARFLFMFSLLAFSMCYLSVVQYGMFELGTWSEVIMKNVLLFEAYASYFSLYLALFYCYGNNVALYSNYVCVGMIFIGMYLFEKANMFFDIEMITSQSYVAILLLAGASITVLMYILSLIGNKNRELI